MPRLHLGDMPPQNGRAREERRPATTYGFRVCVTDSDGAVGEWSPVFTLLVR